MDDTDTTTRSDHTFQSLLPHRVTTTLTWLLFLVSTIYYTFNSPSTSSPNSHRFWQHNDSTPFAQSALFTGIYWLLLFVIQIGYLGSFYLTNTRYLDAACATSLHFVANNLLLFGFVNLWVRSHFWLAEFLLVLNFANLSYVYFQYPTTPRVIHVGVVSAPLAWNFVALYWVGAVAIHSNALAARIIANVAIWGWLGYGTFFLVAYKDYTMGFALSLLSFSTGVGQFLTRPHFFQLQWIFSFTIGAALFLLSLGIGMPGLLGREVVPRGVVVDEENERAPLLADDAGEYFSFWGSEDGVVDHGHVWVEQDRLFRRGL